MLFKLKQYIKSQLFKNKIKQAKNTGQIKLIIGAGGTNYEGWLATDIHILNILKESDWDKYFTYNEIANVLAEHVLEHLNEEQIISALNIIYKYLKHGGCFRIAVPDGFHKDTNYVDMIKPGGYGLGSDDHKVLCNYKMMMRMLTLAGYKVELLEYWDESGNFHKKPVTAEGGYIQRSSENDNRNTNGELNYTSLIIDAKKE